MKRRPISLEPQVRQFSGVPRAMFEACSARPPVDLPFQAAWLVAEAAYPPLRGQTDASRYGPARHRPPLVPSDARLGAPGPCSFGCREGVSVFAPSFPGHRRLSQPRDVRETSLGWNRVKGI